MLQCGGRQKAFKAGIGAQGLLPAAEGGSRRSSRLCRGCFEPGLRTALQDKHEPAPALALSPPKFSARDSEQHSGH